MGFLLIKIRGIDMKIAIIGYGYVGKAMYEFFKHHYEVVVHDPFIGTDEFPDIALVDKEETNSCDLGVVCVPTPRSDDGKCDLSYIYDVFNWLETDLVLLKSTIEIGTTRQLSEMNNKRIVFSPEYCGESTYWTPYSFHSDVVETPFFIFGGDSEDTSKMVDIFMPVAGPVKKYVQCTFEEAELTKYMENSFYAMKIAFCYEINEICETIGIDWNTVRELWLLDPRLNPMHTSVFKENDYPFSGKCLPKDVSALNEFARNHGYESKLLQEVLDSNERIKNRRTERRKND